MPENQAIEQISKWELYHSLFKGVFEALDLRQSNLLFKQI